MEARTEALANAPSLEERAYRIRRNALRMGEVQGQGYIAQALGVADMLAVSYFHALRYQPEDPAWEGRGGRRGPGPQWISMPPLTSMTAPVT